MATAVIDLLQSSGPIALNELVMRLPQNPREVARGLNSLQKQGLIDIYGPLAEKISAESLGDPASPGELTDEEILSASDTFVEPSRMSLHRSFAS